jgi:hypothetical protein
MPIRVRSPLVRVHSWKLMLLFQPCEKIRWRIRSNRSPCSSQVRFSQITAFSLTNSCVYSTDELFKASAYFTDALLPSLDTNLKRPPLTGLFSHNGNLEPPASVLDAPTPATSTSTLLPPINLAPGLVSPSTQSVSRSPLARAQPVIRRLLSRPKLSGATDDRPFAFPISPTHIPTPRTGPVVAPTAFNLSQRTTLPSWTWLGTPENSSRLARFARAMAGTEGWMVLRIQSCVVNSLSTPRNKQSC